MSEKMRTALAIMELQNEVTTLVDETGSKFPSMSYEEGIQATLEWLVDEGEHPLAD